MGIAAREDELTDVWFVGQRNEPNIPCGWNIAVPDVVRMTTDWLDCYFEGHLPPCLPPMILQGTRFQMVVWHAMQEISYGKVVTYGDLARRVTETRGLPFVSPRAVGGAVGRNRIAVIVPCHRVVAANGLGGYAAGIDVKRKLLALEGVRIE